MKKLKTVALTVLFGAMVLSTCATTTSVEAGKQQETSTEKKVTKTKKQKQKKKTKKVTKVAKKKKVKKKKKKQKYTNDELRVLTVIIYMEAGGDYYGTQAGREAVGIVIMNRVRSNKFPNDIYSVLSQSGQFASYGNSKYYSLLAEYDNGTLLGNKAKAAARRALNGKTSTSEGYDLKNCLYFSAGGSGINLGGNCFR